MKHLIIKKNSLKRHLKTCIFIKQCRGGTYWLYKHTFEAPASVKKECTLELVNSKHIKIEKEKHALRAEITEKREYFSSQNIS